MMLHTFTRFTLSSISLSVSHINISDMEIWLPIVPSRWFGARFGGGREK
jgi:hypothetical protein